jgi:diguanylate cyclase (GGDEF)-like protein
VPDRLRQLTEQLRRNERIWAGFRQIELRLLGARSLGEMVRSVARDFPRHFGGVSATTLAWLDPEYEAARLLDGGQGEVLTPPGAPRDTRERGAGLVAGAFVPLLEDQLHGLFDRPYRPYLGRPSARIQTLLFPGWPASRLGSVALAPLVRRGKVIGCLSQASEDPAHFTPEAATDLLEHLAAVTALCVENALNQERLKLDGLTDPLTGIANRRFYERRLEEELDRWRRSQQPLAVLLVDVDHFKRINDSHGHQVGDRVLRRVAAVIGAQLRAADVLARYGGEEFALLLPQTGEAQALGIAERIRQQVARDGGVGQAQGQEVTVSVGVSSLGSECGGREVSSEALLESADQALYDAKRAGRNRVAARAAGRLRVPAGTEGE